MNIIVDIDEVLRDIVSVCIDIYHRDYDKDAGITHADIKTYSLADAFPKMKDPVKELFYDRAEEVFGSAKPFDKAIEGMHQLAKDNYVHLVSYQMTEESRLITFQWLMEYKIPYDAITFIKEKEFVFGHVILDDDVHNLESYKKNGNPSTYLVCMDRPWNQEWTGARTTNMVDFAVLIEKYAAHLKRGRAA